MPDLWGNDLDGCMINDDIYQRYINGPHGSVPSLPVIREYAMHEHTVWGWTDARIIRGSSWLTPPNRFGPPHPSWCYPLWHSHTGTV